MNFIGVTEGLLQYLRELIIDGSLKPGQKLNEIELSSRLQVSRSPLREAFRILATEHLIDFVPRKGCFVSTISMQDCVEIYQAREMLECFAIELMAEKKIRRLPDVESALQRTANLKFPEEDDPSVRFNYLKLIADFHIKLVEGAQNSRLWFYYQSIFPSLARYQSLYVFIRGLMDQSQLEHEQVLDFINKGCYDEAKKTLRRHIRYWPQLLEQYVPLEEGSGESSQSNQFPLPERSAYSPVKRSV